MPGPFALGAGPQLSFEVVSVNLVGDCGGWTTAVFAYQSPNLEQPGSLASWRPTAPGPYYWRWSGE